MTIAGHQEVENCFMKQTDELGQPRIFRLEDYIGSDFATARAALADIGYRKKPSGYLTAERFVKETKGMTFEIFIEA